MNLQLSPLFWGILMTAQNCELTIYVAMSDTLWFWNLITYLKETEVTL